MRRAALITTLWLVCTFAGARDASPNFYLPETATEKKSKPAETPKPAIGKTAEKSKAADPPPLPKRPAQSNRRPAPKAQTFEEFKKGVISALNQRARQNSPDRPFDPPMDPFGLARAFKQRWDFSSFLVTAEEELRFRLNAARMRTLRLARAFSALSSEVEIRQRNLNSAALAAYLLSRDQHSWNPVQGRSLTEAQMVAVKATMRQDIRAMQSALTDYETLRNSMNACAEEVATLEKDGISAIEPVFSAMDRPTVPTAEVAAKRTVSVLQERLVSVEALKATLAAENLSDAGDRRQSIASFAPPPPPVEGTPAPRASVSLPQLPSEEVMKGQPKGETVKAPERTALVVATDINAPVHAVRGGVVMYAGPFRGYGFMVIVEHEKGLFTVYSHLANIQVREREPVEAGSILGRAGIPPELGRSGIHFQVRQGKDAVKVEDWLGAGEAEKLLTRK
jgi:murein DD-endopeptidase MepM/ murein hydrolase activator NlpD